MLCSSDRVSCLSCLMGDRQDGRDKIPDFLLPSHLPEPQAAPHWRLSSICLSALREPFRPPWVPRQRLSSGYRSRSLSLRAGLRVRAESRMSLEHTTRRSCKQRRKTTQECASFLRDRTHKLPLMLQVTLTSAKSRGQSAGLLAKRNSFLPEERYSFYF